MRIMHMTAPAAFGGLERVVQSLATEQARAGHDVHVAAVLDPGVSDHALLQALPSRGVRPHALHAGARAYLRERALVRDLLSSILPDVVHTHGYRTDVLHGPVARSLGIPVVATAHGFIGGDWKNRLYEYLQRRAFLRCAAAVAVSRPMRDGLLAWGIPDERLHWIPNAWADPIPFLDRSEARHILGIDENAWCAGFIGRIGHEKGPDVLVDAMAQLGNRTQTGNRGDSGSDRHRDLHAMFVGDGRMRAELMARGVPHLKWAGAVENAGRLIRAFDLVVLSSRTEGTPMVLLEAMAAGVPVVAASVGGIPDVISDQEAVLVPPADPVALASAIRMAAGDTAATAQRAQRAQQRLERELNASLWRERYDAVYRACMPAPEAIPA